MGLHLEKRHVQYVYALDARVMGKTLLIAGHAPRRNKTMWSVVPFVIGMLKTTSVSGATKNVSILPMRTQSGATCVWKNGANVLAAMGRLHHMDRHSVTYMVNTIKHSVSGVVKLGNVQCANLKSVPKCDGLLVKMFA